MVDRPMMNTQHPHVDAIAPRVPSPLALAAVALAAAAMAGCATVDRPPPIDARPPPPVVVRPPEPLECVPFARRESGIEIYGDAGRWWDLAGQRYRRTDRPAMGGVLVLRGYAGAARGHVAVVRRVTAPREIVVDHANWLNSGEISLNVPVRDVSQAGDWSAVQIWHVPGGHWGARTYSVQGFISR
jgi:hypothetical protein